MAITYNDLENLLFSEKIKIENSKVFDLASKLSSKAEPNYEFGKNDKRWIYFYFPVVGVDDDLLTPAKEKSSSDDIALIPFALIWQNFDYERYYVMIPYGSDGTRIEITKGNKSYDKIYENFLKESIDYTSKLKEKGLDENLVPYAFRTGKIKRKYVVNPEMKKEEAKKILQKYRNRNKGEVYPISLRDYLKTAGYCLRSVFGNDELSDKDLYKRYSDSRRGGMLDLDMDDPNAFSRWLHSRRWVGDHPFEIISGGISEGIVLYPPEEMRKRYILLSGEFLHDAYIKCVEALIEKQIPFDAPDIEKTLEYLTGESYIDVNKGYVSLIYTGDSSELKEHIKWDPLTLPKIK